MGTSTPIHNDTTSTDTAQAQAPVQFPVLDLSIADVLPHPKNTQAHPAAQVAKLKASLQRFGQVKPVVVQYRKDGPHKGKFILYAGHGVTTAIRELGWTKVRAIVLPDTWDEVECKGYLLSDNMRGGQDIDDLLLEALQEQEQAGVDLLTVGSSDEELAALLLQLDTSDGSEGATVNPTMVPAAQKAKQIKAVLYADDLADFEAAIRKTGISNRGKALLTVCRFYLQSDQTTLGPDWIPPMGGEE